MSRLDALLEALTAERFAHPVTEYASQPATDETVSVCAQRCADLVAEVEQFDRR